MTYFSSTRARHLLPAMVLVSSLSLPPALAQDEVVATVDGAEITQRDVALAAEELAPALQDVPEHQHQQFLISYLTDLMLLSQAARDDGLDEDEEFARRMEYTTNRTLMEYYLTRHGEAAATQEGARALYADIIGEMTPETEVSARHILVETEEEAEEMLGRLEAGEDFAELAQEASIDPGSAARGGDLGYFTRERMIPEFADVAFSLEPGETSDPVESQFGWHIIHVEDRRDSEPPSYDEVEGELMTLLTRQAQRDIVLQLREGAEIEIEGQDAELPAPEVMPQTPGAPE